MSKRPFVHLSLLLILTGAGCGASDRAELEKVKAELAKAQTELTALKTQPAPGKPGYLDELERLDVLKQKGAITQEEFNAKKAAALQMADKPRFVSSVEELSRQLRVLHGLWNSNTITQSEWEKKKAQLIQKPLSLTDLKIDLETLKALWNESIITQSEFEALKQKLLEIDQNKK